MAMLMDRVGTIMAIPLNNDFFRVLWRVGVSRPARV